MKPFFDMDSAAYRMLMEGLNRQYSFEKKGNLADFAVYNDDLWLADTAVIQNVHRFKGEWAVDLLFVSIHTPLRFIRRHITSHPCPKRALQKAEYMRRLAAKDQRGTLVAKVELLKLCHN